MNLNLNPNSSAINNRQTRLEEYQELTKTKKSLNLPFNYNTNDEKEEEPEPTKTSFIYKNTGFFGGVSVSDKAITPIKERTVSDINIEKFTLDENERKETENENLVKLNNYEELNLDNEKENKEKASFISNKYNNYSTFNNNKSLIVNDFSNNNVNTNSDNKFIRPHLTPSNNKKNEGVKHISSDIFLPYNNYQSNAKESNLNSRSLNFNNIINNESNVKNNSDNKQDYNKYSLYNQNLDSNDVNNKDNPVEVKVSFKNLNAFNDDLASSEIQMKRNKINQTYDNNVAVSSKSIDYNLQNTSRIRFNTTIIKDKNNNNYKDLKRNFATKRNNDLNTNLALEKVYEEQNKIQEFLFNYNNLSYNNHTQSLTNLGIEIPNFSKPSSRLDSKYNESKMENDKIENTQESKKNDLNIKFDNFTSRNLVDNNNEYTEKSYDKVKSSKALNNLRSIFDSTKPNSIVNKFRNKKVDEQNNLNNLVKYQHIFSDSNFDNKNSTIFQTNLSNADK